jgi:hypothetical protein
MANHSALTLKTLDQRLAWRRHFRAALKASLMNRNLSISVVESSPETIAQMCVQIADAAIRAEGERWVDPLKG